MPLINNCQIKKNDVSFKDVIEILFAVIETRKLWAIEFISSTHSLEVWHVVQTDISVTFNTTMEEFHTDDCIHVVQNL